MKLIIDFHGLGNAWFEDMAEGEPEAWAVRALAARMEEHPFKVGDVDNLRDGNGNKVVRVTAVE